MILHVCVVGSLVTSWFGYRRLLIYNTMQHLAVLSHENRNHHHYPLRKITCRKLDFRGLVSRLPCLWYLHLILDLRICSTRIELRSYITGLWYLAVLTVSLLFLIRFASISRLIHNIGHPRLHRNRTGASCLFFIPLSDLLFRHYPPNLHLDNVFRRRRWTRQRRFTLHSEGLQGLLEIHTRIHSEYNMPPKSGTKLQNRKPKLSKVSMALLPLQNDIDLSHDRYTSQQSSGYSSASSSERMTADHSPSPATRSSLSCSRTLHSES